MAKEAPKPTPAENTSETSRILEGREPDLSGDIDERLARLNREHIEMGARPADEPQSVDQDARDVYPGRAGTDGRKTVIPKSEPKKAAKK
jgi:hypothetical protein